MKARLLFVKTIDFKLKILEIFLFWFHKTPIHEALVKLLDMDCQFVYHFTGCATFMIKGGLSLKIKINKYLSVHHSHKALMK